ncbi:acyltransferase [Levilactobacillus namurensis]|uniref:acyltransferase n=1 Tax=Levilactobacillus namurensis TaxID=380393 RepID=UPI0004658288|nr:DapH/DapD/GlmU-related protein [Levilactobacillus namurensis]
MSTTCDERLKQQTTRLIQHLNHGRHLETEVHQLISEIIGYRLPATTVINLPIYIDCGCYLRLANDVRFGPGVHLADQGGITIAAGVCIGAGAQLLSETYRPHPQQAPQLIQAPIKIGANVQIGAGALILPGVTVGENAVIAPGAVVTESVAASAMIAGNPGKVTPG